VREGFEAAGDEVLVCNEPIELPTAARVELVRKPWRALGVLLGLMRTWVRLARGARALPVPDAVVVGYLGHLDVLLARMLWPRTPIVLDHLVSLADTARDRSIGTAWVVGGLSMVDRLAVRTADVVVVDTDEHRAMVSARARAKVLVVPVGAPAVWQVQAEPSSDGSLRVVWFGLYTPLQGAPVIGKTMALLADVDIEWTMIGHGQDLEEAQHAAGAAARTTWVRWVDAADLPGIVATSEVCLGIFGTSDKARRVVPNKVFQGAAAGCAIVTSDTPPQRRALEDAAVFVPPGDADALAAALRALAADRSEVERLRKAARALADERFGSAQLVAPLRARLSDAIPASKLPALTPNAWLRHDVIIRTLDRLDDVRSVIEIGAGRGAMGARLATRYDYLGVEPDAESHAAAVEAVGARGVVLRGDASVIPSDRVADLVCAFEVLEHLADDRAALKEWRAHLRPGGRLLLSVPAHQRRFGAADRAVGHVRRYDPKALLATLHDAGFDDVELRYSGFPLGFVLERVRNALAARESRDEEKAATGDVSGRWHQPPASFGWLTRVGTAPFRVMQRPFERRGPGVGLIALARKPA